MNEKHNNDYEIVLDILLPKFRGSPGEIFSDAVKRQLLDTQVLGVLRLHRMLVDEGSAITLKAVAEAAYKRVRFVNRLPKVDYVDRLIGDLVVGTNLNKRAILEAAVRQPRVIWLNPPYLQKQADLLAEITVASGMAILHPKPSFVSQRLL
jgi:hypothetical protein